MASTTVAMLQTPTSSTRQAVQRPGRKTTLVVKAQQHQQPGTISLSRREASLAAIAAVTALVNAAPAKAGLFGDNKKAENEYKEKTASMISNLQTAMSLERDDPNREEFLKGVRSEANNWVAKYRRDNDFSGRASFGNTYAAVNALTGHVNSFGYQQPVPKKRAERIVKELEDASRLLERGR